MGSQGPRGSRMGAAGSVLRSVLTGSGIHTADGTSVTFRVDWPTLIRDHRKKKCEDRARWRWAPVQRLPEGGIQ